MAPAAYISDVLEGSPADDAGFTPGCFITSANGHALRDIIDWRWYASDLEVEISYQDTTGDLGTLVLEREEGQDWGFVFDGVLFDETMQCRNACTFCFMRQLPDDSRDSLRLRDDDYRLSFLMGNFVTFTNITPADEARIIEQHISPLRFSLHAVTPALREQIMGKHAQHGLDVAERLLAAGIELHAQIVLMPQVNDGEELVHTLNWAYAHPGMVTVGIVPVGYTKHQTAFSESFNSVESARGLVETIEPFRKRARAERGHAWVHASDEFYRNAYPDDLLDHLPDQASYGAYDMFEDGIGIIRSFVDDFRASEDEQAACASTLAETGQRAIFVCGCAQREFFTPLLAESPCRDYLMPLYVVNDYFGGNVDVTGLLCGCDISAALQDVAGLKPQEAFAVIPEVVFNADQVTLDNMTLSQIQERSAYPVHVVSCEASKFLPEIASIARDRSMHG